MDKSIRNCNALMLMCPMFMANTEVIYRGCE